jgi:hypothetical protein
MATHQHALNAARRGRLVEKRVPSTPASVGLEGYRPCWSSTVPIGVLLSQLLQSPQEVSGLGFLSISPSAEASLTIQTIAHMLVICRERRRIDARERLSHFAQAISSPGVDSLSTQRRRGRTSRRDRRGVRPQHTHNVGGSLAPQHDVGQRRGSHFDAGTETHRKQCQQHGQSTRCWTRRVRHCILPVSALPSTCFSVRLGPVS